MSTTPPEQPEKEQPEKAQPGCLRGCLWVVATIVLLFVGLTLYFWQKGQADEAKATQSDGRVTYAKVIDQTDDPTYSIGGATAVVDHGKGRVDLDITFTDEADNRVPTLTVTIAAEEGGYPVVCTIDRPYVRSGGAVQVQAAYCDLRPPLDANATVTVTA